MLSKSSSVTVFFFALCAITWQLPVDQAVALPCPPGNPPTNCGPPPGAILDLNGTTIPHTYTKYSVDFTATLATTNISFAFRDDPTELRLDDVSVITGGGSNLLLNGGFESGVVGNTAPVDWTYLNTFGFNSADAPDVGGAVLDNAGATSEHLPGGAHSGNNFYVDGAVQGYDGISQAITTTPGSLYSISFWLSEDSTQTTFSRLSTNGDVTDGNGNGVDLLVYAGAVPTLATPEPASLVLLGSGLAGLAGWRQWRRMKQA